MDADAESDLPVGERQLADRLANSRPVPSAGFRSMLARRLIAAEPGYRPRPAHLRLRVIAYLVVGLLLVALGGLVGAGVV
jgi:hypothetical protein